MYSVHILEAGKHVNILIYILLFSNIDHSGCKDAFIFNENKQKTLLSILSCF